MPSQPSGVGRRHWTLSVLTCAFFSSQGAGAERAEGPIHRNAVATPGTVVHGRGAAGDRSRHGLGRPAATGGTESVSGVSPALVSLKLALTIWLTGTEPKSICSLNGNDEILGRQNGVALAHFDRYLPLAGHAKGYLGGVAAVALVGGLALHGAHAVDGHVSRH